MTKILYLCKSCKAFYDGFAQCCMDLDHVAYEVDDENQIIREYKFESYKTDSNENEDCDVILEEE